MSLDQLANGNSQAADFIRLWLRHIHEVDDLVDEETNVEKLLAAFIHTQVLFGTNPFYQTYWNILYPVFILAANAYADSVAWEDSKAVWQRQVANVLRSYGNEMLCMVAYITGGWSHMRTISLQLRERSYNDHTKLGH